MLRLPLADATTDLLLDRGCFHYLAPGLDSYSSPTIEQIGTNSGCDGATASYYAWYELYPAGPVIFSNPVHAGDKIAVSVTEFTGVTVNGSPLGSDDPQQVTGGAPQVIVSPVNGSSFTCHGSPRR